MNIYSYIILSYILGCCPILFLWIQNIAEINFLKLLKTLGYYSIIYLCCFFICQFFVDIQFSSAILISLFIMIFYSKHLMIKIILNKYVLRKQIIWISLFLGIVIFPFLPSVVLDIFFILLLIFEVLFLTMIGYNAYQYVTAVSSYINEKNKSVKIEVTLKENINLPDVYFIIPDSYGGATALNQYYNFNNQVFLSWLEKEGFTVYNNARSNYSHTNFSIPSTFQMNYLVNFKDKVGKGQIQYAKLAVNQFMNKALAIFEQLGYTSYHIVNDFDKYLMHKKGYKFSYKLDNIESYNFELSLFSSTFLAKWIKKICFYFSRKFLLNTFDYIENLDLKTKRNFIYCHLMCPHHPFYFDENGDIPILELDFFNPVNYPKLYVDQIKYLNIRLMRIVKSIKKKNPNAIIIIQADHGAAGTVLEPSNERDIWNDRFSILRAIYAPKEYDLDFISSVNLFPMLFNNWLETPIKIKDDHYWFLLNSKTLELGKLEFKKRTR